MTGKQLYTHYRDCYYVENHDMLASWDELYPEVRKAWERLAQCVTEQKGCTMRWELAPDPDWDGPDPAI